jgi:hypothetical protein
MTDVFDRIKAANPVPDPDRYYESVTGDGRQLLGSIRDRRDHMTVDEITRLETPQDPPSQSGFRGWKVAVTAAAAVVALVVGFVAVGGGGDDVAGLTDLQTAEQFVALLESGDVAGYEALVDPAAATPTGPFFGPSSAAWAYVSRFQAATHGTYTTECREIPTSPTQDVRCTTRSSNIFREAAGLDPDSGPASFGIEDGTITLIDLGGDLIFPALDQITLYDGWLQVNYPEEYAGLMAVHDENVVVRTWKLDTPDLLLENAGKNADGEIDPLLPMPVVDTAVQRARHAELTTEWAATLPLAVGGGGDDVAGSAAVSVVVPGTKEWTDTGIDLSIGDGVLIEADGAVTPSRRDEPLHGPNGVPDRPSARVFNVEGLEEANHNSLIGRIGEAGAPFQVGSRLLSKADTEGRLFLGINDVDVANNAGEFTATITVNPS